MEIATPRTDGFFSLERGLYPSGLAFKRIAEDQYLRPRQGQPRTDVPRQSPPNRVQYNNGRASACVFRCCGPTSTLLPFNVHGAHSIDRAALSSLCAATQTAVAARRQPAPFHNRYWSIYRDRDGSRYPLCTRPGQTLSGTGSPHRDAGAAGYLRVMAANAPSK